MSGSAPCDPRRLRRSPGLPGRCSLFVPALVFGAWTAAGAAQGGAAEGEMTPFLLAIAAILVAAKIFAGVGATAMARARRSSTARRSRPSSPWSW